MVEGNLKCLGSIQHIKSKFGRGYEVEVKVKIPTEEKFNQLIYNTGLTLDLIIVPSNLKETL